MNSYDNLGELFDGRDENSSSLSDALSSMLGKDLRTHMSANQKAAATWYGANGDVEREHTTGVFLKKPRVRGAAPILGVYVDSHSRMTDFTVNREIYLSRMYAAGLELSGIEFILNKRKPAEAKSSLGRETSPSARKVAPLPELSDEEKETIEEECSVLEEPLRSKVARAMEFSLRREKSKKSQNGEKGEI